MHLNCILETALQVIRTVYCHGMKLQTELLCWKLAFFPYLRRSRILRVPDHPNAREPGNRFLKQLQLLADQRGSDRADSREVSSRPCQTINQPSETGSDPAPKKTMEIDLVAFLAARVSFEPGVMITSTLSRTNSSAKAGSRS